MVMPTLEVDMDLERVMVPVAPLLTVLYRCLVSALLFSIVFWLTMLCLLVLMYGTRIEKFLDGVREMRVEREVKTAGSSGPTGCPDAGGT
jgi:hypothetical protein